MTEVMLDGATMRRAGTGQRIARAATLALLLATVIVAGEAVAQTPAPPAPPAPCPTCDTEAEQMAREVEALRRELDRVMRQLARQDGDSAMRRALVDLRATREKLAEAEASLQASRARGRSRPSVVRARSQSPTGYLGVTISNAEHTISNEGQLIAYYHDFPVVESVEPGSPAEKAGILTGDVILAYNGEELKRNKISLGDLLKPGAKVVVRVRRDGERKDITVIVGRRPGFAYSGRVDVVPTPAVPPTAPVVITMPNFEFTWDDAPTRQPGPFSVAAGWGEAFAGADLTASTRELAQFFGRSDGVVVLKVAPGSPAARAGLRVGDIITRAGDAEVEQPLDLQRALVRAERKRVELEIYRRPAPDRTPEKRTVTLRW